MSNSIRVKEWRNRTKERIIQAMGGKCQCCGYDKCNAALDLHHVDSSDKEFSFGDIRANPKTWIAITDELRKCILICANCHREVHNSSRVIPTDYAKFDESFVLYRKQEPSFCPICKKQKIKVNGFCSKECASKHREKIDWSKVDLHDLLKVKKMKLTEIGRLIGVTDNSVKKRARKLKILD